MWRWQTQLVLSDPATDTMGDCWRTCIAALLAVRASTIPHFVQDHETMHDVEVATSAWLRARGLELQWTSPFELEGSTALTMLTGTSPRAVRHPVVGRGNQVAFDPHPTRAGLASTTGAYLIIPLDPATVRPR
jgi:hypothetical protein